MELLSDFPYMIPHTAPDGVTCYSGYLAVCKQLFRFEVLLPSSGELKGATVNCDWRLKSILGNLTHIIQQRLRQCDSLHSYLKEAHSIIERQLERVNVTTATDSSSVCRKLIDDIQHLGWDKLSYIDEDFTEIHLTYTDLSRRVHVIKVHIGRQYPDDVPHVTVQLPLKFDLHWRPQDSRLYDVYTQFVSTVERYREFGDIMSEIDDNTWVLEPEKPTFSATHRRIAISASVSVQITVDASNPRVLPDCKFLGSDQAIAPLQQSLNSNIALWDEGRSVLVNLQHVLNIEFPSPSNTKMEEVSGECAICCAYRLDEQIPDEVCKDSRCQKAFHKACLIEWLRCLPSSKQSFNTMFGSCPYCEKPMTVKMISR